MSEACAAFLGQPIDASFAPVIDISTSLLVSPQLHCFHLLGRAIQTLPAFPQPSDLLYAIAQQVKAQPDVRLVHGCVIHDSVQVVLRCEDVELEAEIQCTEQALAQVIALEDATA